MALQPYEAMVTASRDSMAFVNSTYTYLAVNPAYCEEFGRTQEEILGHTVVDVVGEAFFETTLKPHLDGCLAGESMAFSFWWNSPSRGRRHVDARYDPHFEDDGSVSGIILDERDTTVPTLTKQQLERSVVALEVANRNLEAFSDSVAHDLKTPMLIVTNFSHYLRESLSDSLDEEQSSDLQRVHYAGLQMVHTINDLRDLANVSRSEIGRDEVDLTSLGRGIMDDLTALKPDRHVVFNAEPLGTRRF